ncbi:carbohydrate ABC transporter permease [Micropruina sp.]|uniref:carbohydrate ABC transporter permease n=1 Tax=Micropruina sp. TaxID=2737536 RepID=UPI0039E7203E
MSNTQTPASAQATEEFVELPPGQVDPGLPKKKPALAHYLMVLPALLGFTLFIVVPAIQGAFYSFTNYAGYGDWHFIGFANYIAMFQDPNVGQAYTFTLIFAIVTTLLLNAIALFLAVLLNSKTKWPNLWKGIYFIPMVLSGLVVSYCFQYLMNQSIPKIITWGPLGEGILTNANWAWLGVVFVTLWASFPGTVIIYLAGLSSIGGEVYEAGELDGATAFGQFRHITLPLLGSFIVINTVLGLKNLLNAYDIIIGLTNGGPSGATTSIAMSITSTVASSDVAYGSANAMVFFVVTILLSVAQLGVVKLMGEKK